MDEDRWSRKRNFALHLASGESGPAKRLVREPQLTQQTSKCFNYPKTSTEAERRSAGSLRANSLSLRRFFFSATFCAGLPPSTPASMCSAPEPSITGPEASPEYSCTFGNGGGGGVDPLDPFPDPARLAAACDTLLRRSGCDADEPQCARLELRRRGDAWALALRFDAIRWFTQLRERRDDAIGIARGWIEKVTAERPTYVAQVTADAKSRKLETSPATYCRDPLTCKHAAGNDGGCRDPHSEYSCAWPCPKKDGSPSRCGWYCFDELLVRGEPYEDRYFMMQARPGESLARELLMFPRPIGWWHHGESASCDPIHMLRANADDSWRGHYTNAELVRSRFFWDSVQKRLVALSRESGLRLGDCLDAVAFNFGAWETDLARDPYALECHGHAHIVLSVAAHEKLCEQEQWKMLRGRYLPPQYYAYADAMELQTRCSISR